MFIGFLASMSDAWKVAPPEEHSRLARQLWGRLVIANRTAVAVAQRPELRPLLAAMAQKSSDAALVEPEAASPFMWDWRKRRGSLARLRHDHAWVVVAEAPECRTSGIYGRSAVQDDRPRRQTAD